MRDNIPWRPAEFAVGFFSHAVSSVAICMKLSLFMAFANEAWRTQSFCVLQGLTNWGADEVWYWKIRHLPSEGDSSQPYWHLHPRIKMKWRWVKGRTAGGERAPSLPVHKMPRPSYEVDSVSLSTDPKVTESFRDYLNGRIDRLILWPSRKGYCSALHPFFHTLHPVPRSLHHPQLRKLA